MGILRTMRRFLTDERGTETVEWALIIGLLAVGVLSLLITIGAWATGKYSAVNSGLQINN